MRGAEAVINGQAQELSMDEFQSEVLGSLFGGSLLLEGNVVPVMFGFEAKRV